ncbi:NUDIX hydrolase [Hyphomicrobium sp. CS1GBMeth3]|uniref:NUDIX hydrolase n=1 Tax=Hyphomicrobium sp. CS1GBMeth3 TaxID=1892845 RepID=UPI000AFB2AC0|nr:NUDIX hydrolase [Hyphomicrobium sp. CS1GBMeth3]
MLRSRKAAPHLMPNIAQYVLDQLFLRWRSPDATRQVGALPYAVIEGRIVFLLVTSRRTGRWIVPKGSVVEGETPWRSAEIEALEEAGVEGIVEHEPIGTYRTIKKGMRRRVIEVDLYPLRVTRQHDTWPEQGSRQRHWVLLREAKHLLADPALTDLATMFSRRVVSQTQPVTHRIDA